MKEYVKPELYCESFEMSQHIAACGIDVPSSDKESCATLDGGYWPGLGGIGVFDDGTERCEMPISAIEVYCYTAGTNEAGKLFNS